MKWLKRRFAKGGRISKTKPKGIPVHLAPGEVWCREKGCTWHVIGGSELQRGSALAEHFREKHRDSYL